MPSNPLSKETMSLKENANLANSEHDARFERSQIEERHRSLLRRLEHLAQDAKIERLDKAAALLRQTAECFRIALNEKLKRNQ